MAQEIETFVLAEEALRRVVEAVKGKQWDMPAEGIYSYAKQTQTLRQLINYHVFDDLCVPDTLAGMSAAEVTEKYQGDVLGADPQLAFMSAMDAAVTAVQSLNKDDLQKTVNLSYGDFPAHEYLVHITTFRGFRSYTLAKLIGADSTMDPRLVDGLWDEVVPNIEQWRQMGVFPPAQTVDEHADKQTRLLALTGFLQD